MKISQLDETTLVRLKEVIIPFVEHQNILYFCLKSKFIAKKTTSEGEKYQQNK